MTIEWLFWQDRWAETMVKSTRWPRWTSAFTLQTWSTGIFTERLKRTKSENSGWIVDISYIYTVYTYIYIYICIETTKNGWSRSYSRFMAGEWIEQDWFVVHNLSGCLVIIRKPETFIWPLRHDPPATSHPGEGEVVVSVFSLSFTHIYCQSSIIRLRSFCVRIGQTHKLQCSKKFWCWRWVDICNP